MPVRIAARPRAIALLLALLLTGAALVAAAAPSQAQVPLPGGGPLVPCLGFNSSNVQCLGNLPLAGDGVGARVVGNRLFVTTTASLEIFDITNPAVPVRTGGITANVEFENEEVPTNGRVLGISGQTPTLTAVPPGPRGSAVCPGNVSRGCVTLYDVRGPGAPVQIGQVLDAGDHTQVCVLDCQYMYGSSGSIVDLRGVLATPAVPATKLATNWINYVDQNPASNPRPGSCHNLTEVRPGVLLTACVPMQLLSVNAEDGGAIERPVVLGSVRHADSRFVHGVDWPNGGTDRIVMSGGETNFEPICGADNGAFSTFVTGGTPSAPTFTFADEVRPISGNFIDGNPAPVAGQTGLGCSVHWFKPHRTFDDQGLVALAAYENGTRFLLIDGAGQITESGYFLPVRGSTSAPHWAADGRTVYAIDYERGVDVLRYTGPLMPAQVPEAVIPESPVNASLLAIAVAVLGGAAVLGRRRRA